MVADPNLVGRQAYDVGKHERALKEWAKFEATGRLDTSVTFDAEGRPNKVYLAPGCRFFVDTSPKSPRYGALKRSSSGLITAANYVHGDYDLFAIIPADNPTQNIVVSEQHLASPLHRLNRGKPGHTPHGAASEAAIPNFRGKAFVDVQMMLNRRIGVPMILHGSQEKAVNTFDEEVDVFLANGEDSFSILEDRHLRHFYDEILGGRRLHNFMGGPSSGDRSPLPGSLWQSLGASSEGAVAEIDLLKCKANWSLIR